MRMDSAEDIDREQEAARLVDVAVQQRVVNKNAEGNQQYRNRHPEQHSHTAQDPETGYGEGDDQKQGLPPHKRTRVGQEVFEKAADIRRAGICKRSGLQFVDIGEPPARHHAVVGEHKQGGCAGEPADGHPGFAGFRALGRIAK